jgi:hypothetical protein
MITDLESQLREAMHEDARRARLANPDRPPAPGVVPIWETPRRARSGRRLVALAAAAIVVTLAATGLIISNDDPSRVASTAPTPATTPPDTAPPPSTTPPDAAPAGFIPLPPQGATPSAPVTGVLLLSLQACGGPSSLPWSGNLALYADGRLLWHTYGEPFNGGQRPRTGWLEQRLTPEGAELLRSELASSGLLSRGQSGAYCPPGSYLADALIGDHNEYYLGELPRALVERIADPGSWLPASAWEDREVRPFVPASYGVCVTGSGARIGVSEIADVLPPRVADLVRARDWGENASGPVWFWCTGVATEDAHTFVEALDAAAIQRNEQPSVPGPEYLFEYQDPSRSGLLRISFWPNLPGGRVTD